MNCPTPTIAEPYRIEQLDGTFQYPANSFPGLYPLYYITEDYGRLCPDCANKYSTKPQNAHDPEWKIIWQVVNWEDEDVQCDHCGEKIETAYGS